MYNNSESGLNFSLPSVAIQNNQSGIQSRLAVRLKRDSNLKQNSSNWCHFGRLLQIGEEFETWIDWLRGAVHPKLQLNSDGAGQKVLMRYNLGVLGFLALVCTATRLYSIALWRHRCNWVSLRCTQRYRDWEMGRYTQLRTSDVVMIPRLANYVSEALSNIIQGLQFGTCSWENFTMSNIWTESNQKTDTKEDPNILYRLGKIGDDAWLKSGFGDWSEIVFFLSLLFFSWLQDFLWEESGFRAGKFFEYSPHSTALIVS